VSPVKPLGIGLVAEGLDLAQFFQPLVILVERFKFQRGWSFRTGARKSVVGVLRAVRKYIERVLTPSRNPPVLHSGV